MSTVLDDCFTRQRKRSRVVTMSASRSAAGILAVAVTTLCVVPLTFAQNSKRANQPVETIRLQVRPIVGDTLWMQLDQTIETRNVPVAKSESRPGAPPVRGQFPPARQSETGPQRQQSRTRTIAMRMFAHSLVAASDLQATSMIATTDSMSVRTGTGKELGPPRPMQLPADGREVHVRVTLDGAMSVKNPSPGAMALDATLSGMPPMLPARAVAVGEQWERDIPLPSLPFSGVSTDGLVRARFRLDSLSRKGRLAHVSMHGTLRRNGATRDLPPGTQLVTSGTMQASLVLDRVRGWITEAETTIQVQSDVMPGAGDHSSAVSLDIRLTQRMHVR